MGGEKGKEVFEGGGRCQVSGWFWLVLARRNRRGESTTYYFGSIC